MDEWIFSVADPAQHQLARVHFFSVTKREPQGEIEFLITVKEYARPKEAYLRFFAQADKQTNQKTMPFTPSGWGDTLLKALAECIEGVNRFPYEGPPPR